MNPTGGILIVDDSTAFRQILRETIVESFGHVPLYAAGDGPEAMELVLAHQPDVVFMDISLPGDDGLKVTRHIKEIADPLVIVLSDFDTPEYREAARLSGADHFLSKATLCRKDIFEQIAQVYAA